MRGLDYYNDTVFEFINAEFGAQSTVCGGGRYDGMVAQLGGRATPAFGFGMGLERLIQMLQEQGATIAHQRSPLDVFLVSTGAEARKQALRLQSELVKAGLTVQAFMGEGSIKNQFKRADKSGASLALVVGEQEAKEQTVSLKSLRRQDNAIEQHSVAQKDVVNTVTNLLESL